MCVKFSARSQQISIIFFFLSPLESFNVGLIFLMLWFAAKTFSSLGEEPEFTLTCGRKYLSILILLAL